MIRRCATKIRFVFSSYNAASLSPARHLSDDLSSILDQKPGPKNQPGNKQQTHPLDLLGLQHSKSTPSIEQEEKPQEPEAEPEPELLPPFRSDELLIEYVSDIVNTTPWQELYGKLAFIGDQIKPRHVPELLARCRDSPVLYSFFQWLRARRHLELPTSTLSFVFDSIRDKEKPEEMKWLLREMHKQGIPLDDSMFISGILAYARQGRIELAINVFLLMENLGIKPPKTSTFNCMLRVLLDAGRNVQFDMIFHQLKRVRKLNAISYELAVVKHSRSNAADAAYGHLREMKAQRFQLSTPGYSQLVTCLTRAGRDDVALTLLGEIAPSAEVYCPLIECLTTGGKLSLALTQYKKMLELGLKPSPGTCSGILTELVVTEKPGQAGALFKEMVNSGSVSPAEIVPVVEAAYGKCKIEIVWSFLKDVPGLGCEFDAETIHKLVLELVKNRQRSDLGKKLFRGFLDSGSKLSVETYNLFLQKLPAEGSKQVFELMREQKCEPDVHSYNWVMHSLIRANHLREAYGFFNEMTEKEYPADAFTYKLLMQILSQSDGMSSGEVVQALARLRDKGRFQAAGKYLEKLEASKLLPVKGKEGTGKVLVKILHKDGRKLDEIFL